MHKIFWICLILAGLNSYSGELLQNAVWRHDEGGKSLPQPWGFDHKGTYRLIPGIGNQPGSVVVSPDREKGDACLVYRGTAEFPQGSELVVSGEYRTLDYIAGTRGTIFANIGYNFGLPAKAWQCVFLKPTGGEWKAFRHSKRIPVDVKGPLRAYFYCKGEGGSVEWRKLSLCCRAGSSVQKEDRLYVWREAEKLFRKFTRVKDGTCSEGNASYSTGQPMQWKFRISPVTDQVTLFDREFTYHIWARIYGYIKDPVITVKLNARELSRIRTLGNEKTDSQGNYAGPGSYYWQYMGCFQSRGGSYTLSFSAPRLCMDSILLTDDQDFQPQKFEARNSRLNRVKDVQQCSHEIYAEFSNFGVSPELSSPVSFRITKPVKQIPSGGKPAKFHFSVPDCIEVLGAASHRATSRWGQPHTWLKRPLAWRKTGTSRYQGKMMTDYEMDIYYLCGNQYWWFVRAKQEDFQEEKRIPVRFWLEDGDEKQEPEIMYLTMTSVPKARAFKKIFIGGEGGEFSGFWNGWEQLFETTHYAGLNMMGLWGFERGIPEAQKQFVRKARCENIRVLGEMSPFWPPFKVPEKERALGLDGKYFRRGHFFAPSLSLNEDSLIMKQMCEFLRKSAAAGSMGMLLDDEWSNQIFNKVDYHPETKRLFRDYLERAGLEELSPEKIVGSREKYPRHYQAWVDFRCERMAGFYRLWKEAYVSGLKDGREPFFGTGIQGRRATPQQIKESNFFDYRLLARHCDFITIMCYTYSFVRQSAEIGDTLKIYNDYVGRRICTPSLLCDYEGNEIPDDQKVMLKYQLWEALMSQSRFIGYWMSYGMYNPRNLRHISEGIRQLENFEEILLEGKNESAAVADSAALRLMSLRLDGRVLIYAANYQNPLSLKGRISLTCPCLEVRALVDGTKVRMNGNSFVFDTARGRGQLFLAVLK